jgi:hypothetical protein
VLEINLAAVFGVGGVLPLQGGLLGEIVGNFVAQGIVGDGKAQAVVVGEVAFVSRGKSAGVTVVAEIAGDGRIEIPVGMQARRANGVTLIFAGKGKCSGAIQLIEAAAGGGKIAMPAEKLVIVGGEFNDAPELSPVLGGIAGGEQAQGFDGIGIHVRSKCGRAILYQRLAVHDKLHVVFGAAGMQHAVTFIQPAGFRIHKIEEVAAGLRAELLAYGLLADGIESAGARGVDQRELVGHLNLCGEGRDAESDAEFYGDFGVNFDDIAPCGETFRSEVEAVDAERQILKDEAAVGGNLKTALEAVAFAEQFALGRECRALWIADFKMKFATQPLGVRRDSRCEAEDAGKKRDAELEPFSVHCEKESAISDALMSVGDRGYSQDNMRAGEEAGWTVGLRHKWHCGWRHMVWVICLNPQKRADWVGPHSKVGADRLSNGQVL